jgi:hypothetical protein
MAGPVPAIHVLRSWKKDVDARPKAGHEEIRQLSTVISTLFG